MIDKYKVVYDSIKQPTKFLGPMHRSKSVKRSKHSDELLDSRLNMSENKSWTPYLEEKDKLIGEIKRMKLEKVLLRDMHSKESFFTDRSLSKPYTDY